MILSCNNCGAKFKVNDEAIGPEGRNVRCSACLHEWFQKAIQRATINTELRPSSSKPQVQSLGRKKSGLLYMVKGVSLLAFTLLIFVLAITYRLEIIKYVPETNALFEAIDLHDISNLKFGLVDSAISETPYGDQVELNVKIVTENTGVTNQFLDAIRLSVYTKDQHLIGEYMMPLKKHIEAGSNEMIERKFTQIPKDVTFITIEMGNAFDLALSNQSAILNYQDPEAITE